MNQSQFIQIEDLALQVADRAEELCYGTDHTTEADVRAALQALTDAVNQSLQEVSA